MHKAQPGSQPSDLDNSVKVVHGLALAIAGAQGTNRILLGKFPDLEEQFRGLPDDELQAEVVRMDSAIEQFTKGLQVNQQRKALALSILAERTAAK